MSEYDEIEAASKQSDVQQAARLVEAIWITPGITRLVEAVYPDFADDPEPLRGLIEAIWPHKTELWRDAVLWLQD